jgi:hypothetical protein
VNESLFQKLCKHFDQIYNEQIESLGQRGTHVQIIKRIAILLARIFKRTREWLAELRDRFAADCQLLTTMYLESTPSQTNNDVDESFLKCGKEMSKHAKFQGGMLRNDFNAVSCQILDKIAATMNRCEAALFTGFPLTIASNTQRLFLIWFVNTCQLPVSD